MVTYELVSRAGETFTYHYWPEDDRKASPGTFVVDLATETATLTMPAEKDFKCRTTGAEMNSLREAINQMRMEAGKQPLSEEELPTGSDSLVLEWWMYYDYALQDISCKHDEGVIAEHGMVTWY